MHSTTFYPTKAATSLEKIAVVSPLRDYHLVADPCKSEAVCVEMWCVTSTSDCKLAFPMMKPNSLTDLF